MSEVMCPRCGKRGVRGDEYHEIDDEFYCVPGAPLMCCTASWQWLDKDATSLRRREPGYYANAFSVES